MVMRFKIWMEDEASLGSNMPDMLASMPNRGDAASASAEVKNTGMQPQVDAQEVNTKEKDEKDKILAIDASMQRLDKEIPGSNDEETPKVNKFRDLWQQFKEKWEDLKMSENPDDQSEDSNGLGDNQGNPNYRKMMQQYPNMVPGAANLPGGPGTFGVS